MKVTDVWRAALIRVGAELTTAEQMIAVMSGAAASKAEFDAWDSRLPDSAGRALLNGIEGPDGVTFSRSLIEQFRRQLMQQFDISEADVQKILSGIGYN